MKQENNTGGKGTGRGEERRGSRDFIFGLGHFTAKVERTLANSQLWQRGLQKPFQAGVFMSYGCVVCVGTTAAVPPRRSARISGRAVRNRKASCLTNKLGNLMLC